MQQQITKNISIIEKAGKRYIYDPQQQLFGQTHALDKELVRCHYHEIMGEARDALEAPELSMANVTAKIRQHMLRRDHTTVDDATTTIPSFEEINLPKLQEAYPEETDERLNWLLLNLFVNETMLTKQEPAYKDVAERQSLIGKRAEIYTRGLRKAHEQIIMMDAHASLLIHLLVPEGEEYGAKSIATIKNEVLPKLTIEEVESVISNFLTSERVSRRLSLNYLTQYLPPADPLTPTKNSGEPTTSA